jgi:hypothetical protein
VVQTFRDQFLAGAPLADHQHRAIERRGTARPLDRVEEREALPDELVRPLHTRSTKNLADCWWQIPPIGKDFHFEKAAKFDELPDNS